ncbi:hypothetical protein RUND412_001941 [Rhizina undulata]
MSNLTPSLDLQYLSALCSANDIPPSTLIDLFSTLESAACLQPISPNLELLETYYSAYLFSLFLGNDLNEARFLTKRIQPALLTTPMLTRTTALLKALYTRDFPAVYKTVSSSPWPAVLSSLASQFLDSFRRRAFITLSNAYTAITPSAAAKYLGMTDEQEVVQNLLAEGWEYDSDAGILKPVKREEEALRGDGEGKDGRIGRLVGLVTHLTEA